MPVAPRIPAAAVVVYVTHARIAPMDMGRMRAMKVFVFAVMCMSSVCVPRLRNEDALGRFWSIDGLIIASLGLIAGTILRCAIPGESVSVVSIKAIGCKDAEAEICDERDEDEHAYHDATNRWTRQARSEGVFFIVVQYSSV